MARGLGARRSNELYGGLLGDYLSQLGGLLAQRGGEILSGEALEQYIQELFPGFGAYQITDGKITFPEARAPQGGYQGLLGEMFGAGMSAPIGGLLATFGGKNAKNADVLALEIAQEAERKGLPPERIFDATGWFKGADGKWRFEIDDSAAFDRGSSNNPYFFSQIRHPELREAYDLELGYRQIDGDRLQGSYREFSLNGADGEIGLAMEADRTGTALHELQHAIQRREGFASGGSPEMFVDAQNAAMRTIRKLNDDMHDVVKKLDAASASRDTASIAELESQYSRLLEERQKIVSATQWDPLDAYGKLAGEVEARNVQKRMGLLADDRRMLPPWMTEDVPRDQQIIRFE